MCSHWHGHVECWCTIGKSRWSGKHHRSVDRTPLLRGCPGCVSSRSPCGRHGLAVNHLMGWEDTTIWTGSELDKRMREITTQRSKCPKGPQNPQNRPKPPKGGTKSGNGRNPRARELGPSSAHPTHAIKETRVRHRRVTSLAHSPQHWGSLRKQGVTRVPYCAAT